jgi:hypothetical protein
LGDSPRWRYQKQAPGRKFELPPALPQLSVIPQFADRSRLWRAGFNTKTRRDEGFWGVARVVGHGRTRKFTERGNQEIGAWGLTRRREGTKVFWGVARVVGHGRTRKFTERGNQEIGAWGLTRRREGTKVFWGVARVVGHGRTRKSTEFGNRGIARGELARGVSPQRTPRARRMGAGNDD